MLSSIVNQVQSTFVHNIVILHNIFLCQDIMKLCRRSGPIRCTLSFKRREAQVAKRTMAQGARRRRTHPVNEAHIWRQKSSKLITKYILYSKQYNNKKLTSCYNLKLKCISTSCIYKTKLDWKKKVLSKKNTFSRLRTTS